MLVIGKIFEFEAGHFLPKHEGVCNHPHGHRYQLEIEITGIPNQETGMIMDFGLLKEIIQTQIINIFDHSWLNDYVENPTAENILCRIVESLLFPSNIRLSRVRLWETSTSYAEWRRERCQ